MKWLAVGVAIGAFGVSISLFIARKSPWSYGNVLVVMPLALAAPMVALMSSGLLLIAGFRRASTGEGLEAIAQSVVSAADAQYLGHLALLVLSGVLAVNLAALSIRRQPIAPPEGAPEAATSAEDETPPVEPKLSRRHATSLLSVATLACLAAVATLSGYEQRWVTAPLAIVVAFDTDDMSEFSTNRRELEERRRVVSNTLVAETFRTLVVVVLFFVLFDAFLSGSRALAFSRSTLMVSAALLVLAAALSARGLYRQRELREEIQAGLVRAEPEAGTADDEPDPPPN
jgi:hypothetical protein